MRDVSALLRRFAGVRVCVVGDVIYDTYLEGRATRLAREAPVPVVAVHERRDAAGGAANVAVNLAALGADTRLVSCVGDDDAGGRALKILDDHAVDVSGVIVTSDRTTLAKRRIVAGGQILLRFDEGTSTPPRGRDEQAVAAAVARFAPEASAVVVSDYGAGVVTEGLIRMLQATGSRLVVDGRDPRRFARARPWLCTPSHAEVEAIVASTPSGDRVAEIVASQDRVLAETGADLAMVTVDSDGVVVLDATHAPQWVRAHAVEVRCPAGAGDTFTAAATLALVAGADPATAARLGSAAAAVVVAKAGTATCSSRELQLRLVHGGKVVTDLADLVAEAERHRRDHRRIVFTNGCFDILHSGHVALLNQAKRLGDVLVVGVNDDESVQRLKGGDRPVNALADRVEVLAALASIDHIVPFAADRPVEQLRALRPDVFVKGGDYSIDTIPEAPLVRELGGEVRILELVPERSTTRLIERAEGSPAR